MEIKLTNVFRRTGDALIKALNGTGPRLIINEGGQGSSKTYSILQAIYNSLKNSEPMKTTFCSYALPHLKQGVLSDFDNILTSFGENLGEIKSSPSQPNYYIGKSNINCYGVEGNLALAHGPRRKILFINEANRKITYEVFDQLFTRSEITLVDYNPDQVFWLHDKVMPNIPHTLIRSNFMDNPYLSTNELNNILLKKDKPEYENWWKVYGLGQLGKLEGAIFQNWVYGEFDENIPYGYGCDFGFNDPDVLVKVAINYKDKIIYADQKVYKSGNSAAQFKQLVIDAEVNRNDLIVADCADARMIAELGTHFNVKPVNKTKWTVVQAIKMMQDYKIVITDTSYDVAKELNNYVWSDKKAGIPSPGFDHAMDSIRYYFQQVINKETRGRQIWHV